MSIVTDNWSKIWNGKQADEQLLNRDFETVFMELKRLTGNDTTGGNGVTFDGFKDQYFRIKKYLRMDMAESKGPSIFEVGCGSGPFLLMFQKDGFRGAEGAEQMYADLCWKLDNGFTDAYDPDASYGLWLPSKPETTDDDLQDSWHKAVDGFEGAKLTVTITFTDGSEQTRSMTLHTGKLGVEYKDDTSGPSLTGEVLTDEQAAAEGYIYGVYADIE